MDPRHKRRIKIVQEIYADFFLIPDKHNKNIFSNKTIEIIKHKEAINNLIKKYAIKFPLENIAKVDLAILYLAIYELLYEKKEPVKVIIDEAVETAKELGGEKSYAFINAVLGKIYQEKIAKNL